MKNLNVLTIFILALFTLPINAQDESISEINNYKYIIVPIQYDFLEENNEFLLSSLTKHLFKGEGYTVIIDNEKLPEDLLWNQCLALKVDLDGEYKQMFSFKTDLQFKLIDCRKRVVYESVVGSSRNKNFKEAYHEALREAFDPLKSFYYNYTPKNETKDKTLTNETKEIKEKSLFETPSNFTFEESIYTLKKIEAGYLLLNANGDKEAFINKTPTGNILYNSERLNGSLIISSNGDLEVEYFDRKSGKVEKAIFKKQL